jgi:hypothetical protein
MYSSSFSSHLLTPSSTDVTNIHIYQDSILFGYRKHKYYKSLELHWTHVCGECGASYLNTATPSFVQKCCQYKNNLCVPNLLPLSSGMQQVLDERPDHIMSNALSYNNVLSFAALGIENDKPTSGFEPLGPNAEVVIRER